MPALADEQISLSGVPWDVTGLSGKCKTLIFSRSWQRAALWITEQFKPQKRRANVISVRCAR